MRMLLVVWVFLIAPAMAHAEQATQVEPDLSQLGWLEGCWSGTGFGKRVDECWMRAPDGRLTGMFQLIGPDGRQEMSEIFVLDQFEDGPAIRLKHFHPDLTGWEGQDEFVEFPLRETGRDFARFDGLSYRLAEDGRLIVELMVSTAGQPSLQRLEFQRVAD